MIDVTPLLAAVDRLADQVRALSQSRLRHGVAAEVLALARELSVRAQRLEFPEREPLEIPEVGEFVVADQLAVAGHDLVVARAAAGQVSELAEDVGLVVSTARSCGLSWPLESD